MKNASAATLAILAAGEYTVAELYDLTLASKYGSTVYHFTDFDIPLTTAIYPSGTSYTYALGLTIERGDLVQKIGTQGAELELTISPQWDYSGGPPAIAGYPFLQACRLGILDGATVRMSKIFFGPGGNFATTQSAVAWFVGVIGEAQADRLKAEIKVSSLLSLMTVQMPRSLFQVGCAHTVYDPGCTLSKSAFQVAGTVSSVTSSSNFNTSLSKVDGYFSKAPGIITFTSGVNAGISGSVKQYLHSGGNVQTFAPFPARPAIGDAFTILPGCDHLLATCSNTNASLGPPFNNRAHFKGEPFIPIPETMIDGGTSNPPQQTAGKQAGVIVGSNVSSKRSPS